MDDEQTPWLRLALCPRTPSSLLRELLCSPPEHRQNLQSALNHWFSGGCQGTPNIEALRFLADDFDAQSAWTILGKTLLSRSVSADVEKARDWQTAQPGRHLLTPAHPAWPKRLHTLPDPPAALYAIGNPALLAMDQVAMVGARKASVDGQRTAFDIARELANRNWLITSGLAQGIDTEAHRGCLAGRAPTIAVMATDATHIYPGANRALAAEILDKSGCLITETPLGQPLQRYCFPRRNRIISALSHGVVVVEAALKSGTLTTARHAADQGREVMAVPGSVRNPNVAGCHELIRDGVALVTSAEDIAQNLPGCRNRDGLRVAKNGPESLIMSIERNTQPHKISEIDPTRLATLLRAMGYDAAPLEQLVVHTGWQAAELVTLLLQLELEGQVSRDSAGRYSRCKP